MFKHATLPSPKMKSKQKTFPVKTDYQDQIKLKQIETQCEADRI